MNPADWPVLVKAAALGLVEGVTEFLPISSTGHLILASEWLAFESGTAGTFEVFIQLGAILAVAWLYRRRLFAALAGARTDPVQRGFAGRLLVAFLPAAVGGVLWHDQIKSVLFSPLVVAWALVIGGLVILLIEQWGPPARHATIETIPWRVALGIGLAQVLSLVPGTSRSGATIMGGYALGLSRRAATEFSFFLAVPVMVAATGYDLFQSRGALGMENLLPFLVGFLTAFLSALVVVKAFVGFVSRRDFRGFAWYRIGFGVVLLWWYLGPGA